MSMISPMFSSTFGVTVVLKQCFMLERRLLDLVVCGLVDCSAKEMAILGFTCALSCVPRSFGDFRSASAFAALPFALLSITVFLQHFVTPFPVFVRKDLGNLFSVSSSHYFRLRLSWIVVVICRSTWLFPSLK